MARSFYDLPTLSALDAFEAAARHRSFKRASGELNVTPAAVSHQVKALETDLGLALFDRHRRGVELNHSGALLYAALEHGFSHIAEAVSGLRSQAETRGVRIAATTAVSYLWLTPKLASFWREHGNVQVNQQISDVSYQGERADLEIVYGQMALDRGDCRLLFRDEIVALASPSFARAHPVRDAAALAALPLIHLDVPEAEWTGWETWLGLVGYHGAHDKGQRVNNYVIALQAAQDGMGVVLGWRALTDTLVKTGALVPLSRLSAVAPQEFYIRAAPGAPARALLLRDWLVDLAPG